MTFCWSPAHVGIAGNEKADSLAKAAASKSNVMKCPLPVKDIFPSIRHAIVDVWNFYWQLESQKMKEIASQVYPWKYFPMTRRNEVILCRLRIGHTRLTHGFLMNQEHQPYCGDCLVPLTVRHFMVECPNFLEDRNKYFVSARDCDGRYSLAKILGCDFKETDLFRFLADIGVLEKI